jgi:subtilase family serine protease
MNPKALLVPAAACALVLGLVGSLPAAADDAPPTAPPDAQVTFLAELPHRSAALRQAAQAVSTPGNPKFRQYLTVQKAAQQFGASDTQIARVRSAAKALGLRAEIDPTRLVVRLTGSVSAWEKAVGQPMSYSPSMPGDPYTSFGFPIAPVQLPTAGDPRLWDIYYLVSGGGSVRAPAPLDKAVTRFVAAYAEYVPANDIPVPQAASAQAGDLDPRALYFPGGETQTPPANPAANLMRSCLNQPGAPFAPQSIFGAANTPNQYVGHEQVFGAYGLNGLQRTAGKAASGRIAIISEGGGFSDQDLADAAECFGFAKPDVRITTGTGVRSAFVNVDDETTLDVQTVSSTLANAEAIHLLQVAPVPGGVVLADAYSRLLTLSPKVHAATLSYGDCEPMVADKGLYPTAESLFQMAALVGVTITVSSGDGGSSVCQEIFGESLNEFLALVEVATQDLAKVQGNPAEVARLEQFIAEAEEIIAILAPAVAFPRPTVSYPGSSPFVVSVGGTQILMNPDGTRAGEVVWNSQPYTRGFVGNLVGSGGPSAAFDAPWYQSPLTRNAVRMVPDIAAMAGPTPAIPLVLNGVITGSGGTSQSSPMMAAALALLSTREVQQGRPPIGFANPWLYQVAKRHPNTMYDVTIGENQFAIPYGLNSTNIPACCQAGLGYDMASGLGVPVWDQLAKRTRLR